MKSMGLGHTVSTQKVSGIKKHGAIDSMKNKIDAHPGIKKHPANLSSLKHSYGRRMK